MLEVQECDATLIAEAVTNHLEGRTRNATIAIMAAVVNVGTGLLSSQSALLLFLCWFRVIWCTLMGSILQAAVFRAHDTRTVEMRVNPRNGVHATNIFRCALVSSTARDHDSGLFPVQ
ncbi:hypothetical protein V8E53_012209 [Lactarius tabidus]